jgi:hypothetical protein
MYGNAKIRASDVQKRSEYYYRLIFTASSKSIFTAGLGAGGEISTVHRRFLKPHGENRLSPLIRNTSRR